jgi:tellurite resistance protein
MRPLMGVRLAPPMVTSIAAMAIDPRPNRYAEAAIYIGLAQAILLAIRLRWLTELPFGMPYWAFSFGVAASGAAPAIFVAHGGTGPIAVLAPALFAGANAILTYLTIRTAVLIRDGRLLPPA